MGKKNRKIQQLLESEVGKENRKTQLPSLLTIQDGRNAKQSICRPLESRTHNMCIPILIDKRILGSTHGWLVLVDMFKGNCCIWNPSSNDTIELPSLEKYYLYNKCVLSKPPTEPDCHILFNSPRSCFYSFCKIGDIEYVHQYPEEEQLVAITYFQGKIYGVTTPSYKFVTIEFVGKTIKLRPILINGEQQWKAPVIERNWVVEHDDELIGSSSGNEFLLVIKDYAHHNFIVDGSEYRVFRVDINLMECCELDDLHDQVILIGFYGNGYCCSVGETNLIKSNSIYHTSNFDPHVYIYDLDEKTTISWLPPVDNIKFATSFWIDLELSS